MLLLFNALSELSRN